MTAVIPHRSATGPVALVALGVVLSLLAATGGAQSLASAARKEKERRAKIATPGKLLTEDAAGKGSVSVTELSAPGDASTPPTPTGSSAEEQRKMWKARADEHRAAVISAQKALEQMERDASAFRSDVAAVSGAEAQDPMRLQKREARLAEMNKQIDVLRAAVAAARANISVLEDEARRAAVPPGWLR